MPIPCQNTSKIFTIIVTCNGSQWIERCIKSVVQSSVKTVPVVIDNGSTDDTLNIIRRVDPDIVIFPQEKNLGFGAANNIGISYALNNGAEFVYLLNQDAYLERDTLKTLVVIAKSHPEYGILSPLHLAASRDVFDFATRQIIRSQLDIRFIEDLFFGKPGDIYETAFVNAAHWLLTKRCLLTVGGFSPTFFHYCEDTNFAHRACFHGFKIGVCPSATAIHDREGREAFTYWEIKKRCNLVLLAASNINNNLLYRTCRIVKYSFKALYAGFKFGSPFTAIKSLAEAVVYLPLIRKNNRIARRKGPAFLAIAK